MKSSEQNSIKQIWNQGPSPSPSNKTKQQKRQKWWDPLVKEEESPLWQAT